MTDDEVGPMTEDLREINKKKKAKPWRQVLKDCEAVGITRPGRFALAPQSRAHRRRLCLRLPDMPRHPPPRATCLTSPTHRQDWIEDD